MKRLLVLVLLALLLACPVNATVSDEAIKVSYSGNDATLAFDFTFKVFNSEDLEVILVDATGAETVLDETTHYSVTGSLSSGGKVTLVTAPATGETLLIRLDVDLEQETDLIYGGRYSARSVETMADRGIKIDQQQAEELTRAIKFKKSSSETGIEIPALEASKYLKVNSAGDGLEFADGGSGSGGNVSTSGTPVDNDFAKFVDGTDIEGRSYSEVRSDLNVADGATANSSDATLLARTNHTGTQTASTISDFDTEVGNNTAVALNTAKDTNATHTGDVTGSGALTIGSGKVTEAMQVLADNTTQDVSSSKHGYAPKGDGTTTKFLNANGAYSTPSGGGDVSGPATNTDEYIPQWNGADSKTLKNGFAKSTLALSGANTDITSILNAALYLGRDSDNKIDFATDDTLKIKIGGVEKAIVSISAGAGDNDKLVTQGYVDDNAGAKSGYDTIDIPAGAMIPCTTNGAEASTEEYGTNDIDIDVMAFDDGATEERVQFTLVMPENWNRSTIKAKFYWGNASGASASDTVEWGIKAGAISNDDPIDAALGTAVVITDTVITDGDLHVTSATPVLTVGGTPALGDLIQFEVYRNTDGTDDMAEDAWLIAVVIQYQKSNAIAGW